MLSVFNLYKKEEYHFNHSFIIDSTSTNIPKLQPFKQKGLFNTVVEPMNILTIYNPKPQDIVYIYIYNINSILKNMKNY